MAEKESIKVVIRTRPTPDFASKNINIDPSTQVSKLISNLTLWLFCVASDSRNG